VTVIMVVIYDSLNVFNWSRCSTRNK